MGKFLHLLHIFIVCLLNQETDPMIILQMLKICSTLLTVTPYDKMKSGLASVLSTEIYE